MALQQPNERELSAPLPPSPPTEISTSVSANGGEENEEVATHEGDDGVDEEGGEGESEVQEEESKENTAQIPEPGVHKGSDDWTAVWSPECVFLPAHDASFLSAHVGLLYPRSNAYYFWNAKTNTTTWDNPLETPVASTSAAPLPDEEAPPPLPPSGPDYGGIDPDLAYLDPSLSRSTAASSATPYFQARFNSRTGRFQGDPTMNPDRISEFKRGERQQEAYYDVSSWQSSLDGKGIKRSGEEAEGSRKKKVTTKEVEQFKQNRIDKKRKKLSAWLA